MDRWLLATQVPRLRDCPRPLVVDLGYGSSAVTTLELVERLGPEVDRLEVVGLEIDPARVAAVEADRDPPRVDFRVGGFELAGLQPVLVRAFNVLRQYDEESAARAWDTMRAALGPGGVIVEGTCDEWGRRSAWVALDADGPLTLTLVDAGRPTSTTPSDLAERLPKALIHHNVPGQPIHEFLRAFDARVGGGRRTVDVRPAAALGGGRRGARRPRAGRWSGRRGGGGTARSRCDGRPSHRPDRLPPVHS